MAEPPESTTRPYKFLDYYGLDDCGIFFGRKTETEILLSDIIASRLVILFAKTGTGKSSLINAGVRPRLHQLDYATFWFRVATDAAEAARNALRAKSLLPAEMEGRRLSEQLDYAVKTLDQPIVLFFDQFEEFFLSQAGDAEPAKNFKAAAKSFIQEVGQIYRKRDAGVHIVFSMREEYFHEMSEFRDEIPSIFRNDSMLRLRWFADEQARAAIEEPARVFQVIVEPDVVDQLIRDLSDPAEGGLIEPAQIQIVCDTLWRHRLDGRITLDQYRKLDTTRDRTVSIARQVLFQRLEEQFDKIEDKQELDLLARLLPALCTPKKTKRLWELDALATNLNANADMLSNLVKHLERSAMLRTTQRGSQLLLELTHDYLVDGLDDIAKRVRFIRPRRILNTAWKQYTSDRTLASRSDLEEIAPYAHALTMTSEQCEFLFVSAAHQGNPLRLWFDLAKNARVDVWTIVERTVLDEDKVSASYSAVHLLGELQTEPAMDLLQRAMQHENEDIASSAIETLGGIQTLKAVQLLEEGSRLERRLGKIQIALGRLTHAPKPEVAEYAQRVEKDLPKSTKGTSLVADSKVSIPSGVIRSMLKEGNLIPFLGSRAAYTTRQHGETWAPGGSQSPPTQEDLAKYLARLSGFPIGDNFEDGDLAIVASYFSLISNGNADLYEILHKIYTQEFVIPPLYKYLADLPDLLLIVTHNFDRTLERAFDEVSRPYDLVIDCVGPESFDSVLVWRFGASEIHKTPRRDLDKKIHLDSRTVIYKMQGSVVPSDPSLDCFAITEGDHVDMIARHQGVVPPYFMYYLSSRSFLFLGYDLRNWLERVFVLWLSRSVPSVRDMGIPTGPKIPGVLDHLADPFDLLNSEIRRARSSWAIDFHPSQYATRLWNAKGVKSYDLDSLEFIRQLREEL